MSASKHNLATRQKHCHGFITFTNLMRFFLLGSSATIPGQNRVSSALHLTTTRVPIASWSPCGMQSKAMWLPETRLLLLSFSSKLILYFNLPLSAETQKEKRKNFYWGFPFFFKRNMCEKDNWTKSNKRTLHLRFLFFPYPLLLYLGFSPVASPCTSFWPGHSCSRWSLATWKGLLSRCPLGILLSVVKEHNM